MVFGLDKSGKNDTTSQLKSLCLSFVFGCLIVISSLIKIIILRTKYFRVKRRNVPPNCLSSLGRHEFAQLKNVKLHYVVSGKNDKPLLLFIHGFPEFWFSWRHQIKEFSKDYCVVAPDLRGYGESEKPVGAKNYTVELISRDIKELIEFLNKDQCILVGHDWGGIIAWEVAVRYPHLINKLVVLNAPHPLAFREVLATSWKQFFMSWYIYFFNIPYLPELYLLSNDLEMFDKVFKSFDKRQLCSPEELEAYRYVFSKPNALTYPLNYYRALVRGCPSKPPKNYQVVMQTLIVWGLKDFALSQQLATVSQKYCNDPTFKGIENCSHFVMMEQPELVNKHIREFLK